MKLSVNSNKKIKIIYIMLYIVILSPLMLFRGIFDILIDFYLRYKYD